MKLNRIVPLAVLLFLIAADLAMLRVGTSRHAGFWAQPGAWRFVAEPVLALVIWAAVFTACFLWARGQIWDEVLRRACVFGLASGIVDLVNIAIENGIPFSVQGPSLQITFMLTLFVLWGVAGFVVARKLKSIRRGIISAILSAGVCMTIAVAGGFALQFLVRPPDPAYVATWPEFLRSGWSNPAVFAVAETLDAAFTHLLIAPVIAAFFGAAGAAVGARSKA